MFSLNIPSCRAILLVAIKETKGPRLGNCDLQADQHERSKLSFNCTGHHGLARDKPKPDIAAIGHQLSLQA